METMQITFDWLEVTFEFNYEPGDPGVHTFSNGDPGYPPSGPEIEIIKAWIQDEDGNDIDITPIWDAYISWMDKTYIPELKGQVVNDEDGSTGFSTSVDELKQQMKHMLYLVHFFKEELWDKLENTANTVNPNLISHQEMCGIIDVLIGCDITDEDVCTQIDEGFDDGDDGPDPDFDDGDDGYRDSETEAMEWGGCDLP